MPRSVRARARDELGHGRALIDRHTEPLHRSREPLDQLRRLDPRGIAVEHRLGRSGDADPLLERRTIQLDQILGSDTP